MEVMDQVRFNSGESGWDWKSIMGEDLTTLIWMVLTKEPTG